MLVTQLKSEPLFNSKGVKQPTLEASVTKIHNGKYRVARAVKDSDTLPWIREVQSLEWATQLAESWVNQVKPKRPTQKDYVHDKQWHTLWEEYAESLVVPTYLECTEIFADGGQLVDYYQCVKVPIEYKLMGEIYTADKNTNKFEGFFVDEPVTFAQLKKAHKAWHDQHKPELQPTQIVWVKHLGYCE